MRLATDLQNPTDLALMGDNLFWTEAGTLDELGNDNKDGRLRRVPTAGGVTWTLVENRYQPGKLLAAEGRLIWRESTGQSQLPQQIVAYSIADAQTSRLAQTQAIVALAVDGNRIVWARRSGQAFSHEILALDDELSGVPTNLFGTDERLINLLVQGGVFYTALDGAAEPGLYSGGPGQPTLYLAQTRVSGPMALGPNSLYFTTEIARLRRVARTGGEVTNLSNELFGDGESGGPGPLAVDAAHVYWSLNLSHATPSEYALGTLFKTPVQPGDSEPWVRLAHGLIQGVVEHGNFVYLLVFEPWNDNVGHILKVQKAH